MFLAVPSSNGSATGPQGPQGPPGVGSQGPQGAPTVGAQGPQGPPGAGTQGAQGASSVGAQGPQGASSSSGPIGSQGAQGANNQGQPGPQGSPGIGTQGAQGLQGSVGASGISNTVAPVLNLVTPSAGWAVTLPATRTTRADNLVSMQFRCRIGGNVPSGATVVFSFNLLKADFGTPLVIAAPSESISYGSVYISSITTPIHSTLSFVGQTATIAAYRITISLEENILAASTQYDIEDTFMWYVQ